MSGGASESGEEKLEFVNRHARPQVILQRVALAEALETNVNILGFTDIRGKVQSYQYGVLH